MVHGGPGASGRLATQAVLRYYALPAFVSAGCHTLLFGFGIIFCTACTPIGGLGALLIYFEESGCHDSTNHSFHYICAAQASSCLWYEKMIRMQQ